MSGINISHKLNKENDCWKNLVDIPNFKESEFSFISDLGRAGYKFIKTDDGKISDGLLLFCKLDNHFSEKLDKEETLEALDRLMKVISNLVPIPKKTITVPLLNPSDRALMLIKNEKYDPFQIEGLLGG